MDEGWWCPEAGKVTVGLASHWPCVTDLVVYPLTGSAATERDEQPANAIVTELWHGERSSIFHYGYDYEKRLLSSVTWPFDSWGLTSYRWSILTMRLSRTVTEICHLKDNGVTSLTFWGHVTSSVTWPFASWGSTSYRWSRVTMRLSSTVMEIWPFKFFQEGSSRNRGRSLVGRWSVSWSVLNITLILYTPVCYVRNIAREE